VGVLVSSEANPPSLPSSVFHFASHLLSQERDYESKDPLPEKVHLSPIFPLIGPFFPSEVSYILKEGHNTES